MSLGIGGFQASVHSTIPEQICGNYKVWSSLLLSMYLVFALMLTNTESLYLEISNNGTKYFIA